MKLLEIRNELEDRLKYLPDWIDCKSSLHIHVWYNIQNCHDILFVLIVNIILSDKAINKIIKTFNHFFDEILSSYETELIPIVNIYFISIVEYMTILCIEREEYEAAANIKKFSDLYFGNYENL